MDGFVVNFQSSSRCSSLKVEAEFIRVIAMEFCKFELRKKLCNFVNFTIQEPLKLLRGIHLSKKELPVTCKLFMCLVRKLSQPLFGSSKI